MAKKSNRFSKRAQLRRVQGPDFGYCSICGLQRKLTKDHIPPQGCIKIEPVVLNSFLYENQTVDKKRYQQILQQGLYVKSICKLCNNDRLGKQYDPHLKDIVNQVARITNLGKHHLVSLPNPISLTIKPHRVARAIIGHLLAAKPPNSKPLKYGPMYLDFQKYFLDIARPLPKSIEIFYWLSPSEIQAIYLGYGYVFRSNKENLVLGDFLKFFPLAFWVIFKRPAHLKLNVNQLRIDPYLGIDDYQTISFDFKNVPRLDWPEMPDDDSYVSFNKDFILTARPKS